MKHLLSKSQFLRGLQCRKSLWLYRNRPELRTPPDEAQQTVFERGNEVGLLARNMFPGGEAVAFEGSTFEEKLARTQELINAGVETIYEATFSHDGVLVMVDILHHGMRDWELYEVKSSTEVKDIHLSDVALQYYVLTGSGLSVSKASLVHINNQYVRHGDLDMKCLFTIAERTASAEECRDLVEEDIRWMRELDAGKCLENDIGPHCSNPYDCDFMAHCWAHLPTPSVFDISRFKSEKKFELYYKGIRSFKDISETCSLNPSQRMQVNAELSGKKCINVTGIQEFLNTLSYPLYFLDFETFQPVVPLFDGTRPYEQIPFQYSLHILEREGEEVKHREFLAEAGKDPREELARKLVTDIPTEVCILAYNMAFEKGVIKRLAGQFPSLAARLMNIHDNICDLMVPFRRKDCYTREMNGSYSIKSVLPALVPGQGYDGMVIGNGGEAMCAYAALCVVKDGSEADNIRKALLDYCRLDTYGMVLLLCKLRDIATQDNSSEK